jgi:hypothetical protein
MRSNSRSVRPFREQTAPCIYLLTKNGQHGLSDGTENDA